MLKTKVTIINKLGLHARAAAKFVHQANKFDSHIIVEKDSERVNGKSIMGILMLGAEEGSLIVLEAEGPDADRALLELERLVIADESDIKA